jgi:hypothetical protein
MRSHSAGSRASIFWSNSPHENQISTRFQEYKQKTTTDNMEERTTVSTLLTCVGFASAFSTARFEEEDGVDTIVLYTTDATPLPMHHAAPHTPATCQVCIFY